MNIPEFKKDRLNAMRSLDKATIEAYAKKYGVPLPVNEEVFWIAVHKVRLIMTELTEEEKQVSRDWLKARGYSESII